MRRIALLLALVPISCSTSSSKPVAPPPASGPAVSPTPSALARINPNVVEETDTYYVERLLKTQYIKVDATHIRNPMLTRPIEFYKEDEQYYYIRVAKLLPEEIEAMNAKAAQAAPAAAAPGSAAAAPAEPKVPAADFEDLVPARTAARIHLERVQGTSLPEGGMWRASFALADVNGDGLLDIVAPPARMGDGKLHVWLGDGKGHFGEWPLTFTEGGKALSRFPIDYGGVAVGDIDGDGHADIVTASHGYGLVSFFGDGKGGFEIVRTGLPARDFSSQAVALIDADGDGKLDILASRDAPATETSEVIDKQQIRVYLFQGRSKGWSFKKEGLVNGNYSNSLTAWDYDGDGRKDLLTASHQWGGLVLLWKNGGNATFSQVFFTEIQGYAYHFASAPGTLGKARRAAFADSFILQVPGPDAPRAAGISVYSLDGGKWTALRVWRKKDPKSSVFGLAMGDLDGDGLDDLVFLDSDTRRVRILYQQPDGTFAESDPAGEPVLASPGQCVRLADIDGDGRLDLVVSRTYTSADPTEKGGFDVYLNRK